MLVVARSVFFGIGLLVAVTATPTFHRARADAQSPFAIDYVYSWYA